jgi:hypothetical protein
MTRRYQKPQVSKEMKQAQKIARLLTEDFSMDLEAIGYNLVKQQPLIVYHRFEVVALSAGEEYDTLMETLKKGRP